MRSKSILRLILLAALGVYGAAISTFLCNLTVTGLNFYFLRKCVSRERCVSGFFQIWCKPLLASSLSILASLAVYVSVGRALANETVAFFAAVITAISVYGVFALLLRIVTKEDLAVLPLGKKILHCFERRGDSCRRTKMNIKNKEGKV